MIFRKNIANVGMRADEEGICNIFVHFYIKNILLFAQIIMMVTQIYFIGIQMNFGHLDSG